MHDLDLILTLAGAFTAALIFGYLTQRLGLSPIVGYLLAGTLVGPHTPGFVANTEIAEQLAEVGVILLMFGVGLQFHIEELLAVEKWAASHPMLWRRLNPPLHPPDGTRGDIRRPIKIRADARSS